MYDKVRLWMPRMSNTPDIANYLDRAVDAVNTNTGEHYIRGSVGGLMVKVFLGGFSVIGSLPRYLNGSNIYSLDRHGARQAIEKLSDMLHLDVGEARVTGLEVGTQFPMKKPVATYLIKLGDMPRFKRYLFNPSSLYYKQNNRRFVFYDKGAEAATKGMAIPRGLDDANLLKYEMRIDKRVAAQLKLSIVDASMLAEIGFYRLMVRKWQEAYFTIAKQRTLIPTIMNHINTPTDAFNALVAMLINKDTALVASFMEELKAAKVFDDRKNLTRLKNKIQGVASKATLSMYDEDIRELDDEIKNAGAYI